MGSYRRVRAFIKLTRLEHSLILAAAVVAAEIILGLHIGPYLFVLALIPPIFVGMGSFAINDYFDVNVDRRNGRYDRPLVNRSMSRGEAYAIAMLSFLIGIVASALINMYAFAITAVFAALAYLYSYRLKEVFLLGNMYIALTMVIPFIYGNFVISSALNPNIILISITVFLSGLAREIHGMVRDVKGDTHGRNVRGVVYYIGKRRSNIFASILYVLAVAVSLYMFIFMRPFAGNAVYLIPILAVDIVIIYNVSIYFRKRAQRYYSLSRNISLAVMGIAVLVYIVSSLVYVSL